MQAIQYLSADYQPTASHSAAAITQLTRNLAAYDLTKAEKLQIVNLAPVEPVELYVVGCWLSGSHYTAVPDFLQIVEELEDRFGEQIDDMLSTVRASLADTALVSERAVATAGQGNQEQAIFAEYDLDYPEDAEGWDYDADDNVFDDTGEGMGVEGDLDVEED